LSVPGRKELKVSCCRRKVEIISASAGQVPTPFVPDVGAMCWLETHPTVGRAAGTLKVECPG